MSLLVAQKKGVLIYEKRSKRYENNKEDCIAKPSHVVGERKESAEEGRIINTQTFRR
ncbi:hypothetical protein C5S36_03935 [Candidatus Methanophagaceae archaeon]|jgi:hypothetical protein|nr:hypothetical protein C5S36_03935 [Methanophagales archaeon]